MRRFLRGAMVVFGWFVVPYSRIALCRTAKKKLPPITNPLLEIPAIKLAVMIRNKEVSEFVWVGIAEKNEKTEIRFFLR